MYTGHNLSETCYFSNQRQEHIFATIGHTILYPYMKKIVQNVLLVLVLIVVFATSYFLTTKQRTDTIDVIPNARTLYEGSVEIEPVLLSEIKTKLEVLGCRTKEYRDKKRNTCLYQETEIPGLKETGIEIYPLGPGFGPMSFFVTENKLLAEKDIIGLPDPEKFKEDVRQDVASIGNIIQIKENSWNITKTTYPWTVRY